MFLSADVERGQPDAYDNTLTNETTELNQPIHLSGVLPCGYMINVYKHVEGERDMIYDYTCNVGFMFIIYSDER
jgi:hypothetical protein